MRIHNRLSDESGQSDTAIGVGILVVIVVIIGFIASLFAFKSTPADKIALSYGGGFFEGEQFQKIVQPGSGLTANGFGDRWYEYPVTKRDYIVSLNPNEGDDPGEDAIAAVTSDRVEVQYQLAAYFQLNTDLIRQFHEQIGKKFKAYEGGGWDKMLNVYFRNPIESALQTASRDISVDELYSGDGLRKVEQAVSVGLKDRVNRLAGDDFFCGTGFKAAKDGSETHCPDFQVILKKPVFPQEIVKAFEAQKVAEASLVTQDRENERKLSEAENKVQIAAQEAEALRLEQSALTGAPDEYLRYLQAQQCAASQTCTLIVGGGTGVNVNTGP